MQSIIFIFFILSVTLIFLQLIKKSINIKAMHKTFQEPFRYIEVHIGFIYLCKCSFTGTGFITGILRINLGTNLCRFSEILNKRSFTTNKTPTCRKSKHTAMLNYKYI